jgi:hypothetical protein
MYSMPLTRKKFRTFAASCEHLISLGLTTAMTDDERSFVAPYISELQVLLNRHTREHALAVHSGGQ